MTNRISREHALLNDRRTKFEAIVRQHSKSVFNLAYSILGNRALAEDVAQDVFIRIWERGESFQGRSAFTTWLYSVTRNAAISERRKQASRGASVEASDERLSEVQYRRDDEASADFLQQRRVGAAIEELPANMRVVIRLYYLEENSVDRVSVILQIPIGTVKTLLSRARIRLSKSLASLSS